MPFFDLIFLYTLRSYYSINGCVLTCMDCVCVKTVVLFNFEPEKAGENLQNVEENMH